MKLNKMYLAKSTSKRLCTERTRRWVDGSSTWLRVGLHRLAAAADGGGSGDYLSAYIKNQLP